MTALSQLMEYSVRGAGYREFEMDRVFRYTTNRLIYAVSDVKKDIARLDEEFGQ